MVSSRREGYILLSTALQTYSRDVQTSLGEGKCGASEKIHVSKTYKETSGRSCFPSAGKDGEPVRVGQVFAITY